MHRSYRASDVRRSAHPFMEEYRFSNGGSRMAPPAEVEEPQDAPLASQQGGLDNIIEVEEVIEHPLGQEAVQDQQSSNGRQPILLGMPTTQPQPRDIQITPKEEGPSVLEERRRVQASPDLDGQTEDVLGHGNPEEDSEAVSARIHVVAGSNTHLASSSTFVSSLRLSNAERRGTDPASENVSRGDAGREREHDMGSDIISSLAWEPDV